MLLWSLFDCWKRCLLSLKHLNINWHFIGKIQSNKTRDIAEKFQWVHTVDRLKIAERLNSHRPHQLPKLNVCIQVNQANETQKNGVQPSNVANLAREIMGLPKLRLRGLMTIPPITKTSDNTRSFFAELREQKEKLICQFQIWLKQKHFYKCSLFQHYLQVKQEIE